MSGQLELRADVPVSVLDVLEAPVLNVKGGLPYKAEDFNWFKETVRNVEGASGVRTSCMRRKTADISVVHRKMNTIM